MKFGNNEKIGKNIKNLFNNLHFNSKNIINMFSIIGNANIHTLFKIFMIMMQ